MSGNNSSCALTSEKNDAVEYRTLSDFPGYRFGSDGSIWSCWKTGCRPVVTSEWHKLSFSFNKRTGYLQTQLPVVANGQRRFKTHRVNVVICWAFTGQRPHGMEARHDNGIRTDNRASNLNWGTPKENSQDKYRHGTIEFGEKHHNAVLTEDDVRAIRREHSSGLGYRRIGLARGLNPSHVRDIIKRKIWTTVA